MDGAEKLAALLGKLQRNRENVPLEVLKTRYKKDFDKLQAEIKEELLEVVKKTAVHLPDWLRYYKINPEYREDLAKIYDTVYESGGYARKLGIAAFAHFSLPEIEALAKEINEKYRAELLRFFHSKTGLLATRESFIPDDPQIPWIYNELVDKFWDDKIERWTDPHCSS